MLNRYRDGHQVRAGRKEVEEKKKEKGDRDEKSSVLCKQLILSTHSANSFWCNMS
jgi:hypothetical protein